MRKLLPLIGLLALPACQKPVPVPTAQELVADPKLFAEWQAKCTNGEYAHLGAAEKNDKCATTTQAGWSLAEKKSGKAESDFFEAMSRRKEKRP